MTGKWTACSQEWLQQQHTQLTSWCTPLHYNCLSFFPSFLIWSLTFNVKNVPVTLHILKNNQLSWTPLCGHISWDSCKQTPKVAVCSPDLWGWGPALYPAPSSQDPEFNHPIVTGGKAAPDLYISHVSTYEVLQDCLPLSAPWSPGSGICH